MNEFLDESGKVTNEAQGKLSIVLPCDHKDFGNFISNLLGKPQTIEKLFKLTYQFDREDVSNTFQLIHQRVSQQNDASLVQFTVKVVYDNDESVLYNTLEDFIISKEIQPVTSVGVVLSWTYLITFKNKTAPEKQEIDLVFRSDISANSSIFEDGIDITKSKRYFPASSITLRVCHTDRTWGTDIESLITGHVKTLKIEESGIKSFIRKKSGWIGWIVFLLLICSAVFTVYIVKKKVITTHQLKLAEIADSRLTDAELVNEKFNFIASFLVNGTWGQLIDPELFMLFSFVIATFFGLFVCVKANSRQYSFVLLTKAAEVHQRKVFRKTKRDWNFFYISLGTSIITGIVSNILFVKYFSTLIEGGVS